MIGTNSMSLFLFFSSISSFLYTSASLTYCRPDQRDTLLEFKSEFGLHNPSEFLDEYIHDYLVPVNVTSYPKTKSWANNSDCCQWDGITCDANSGMVTGVDLSYSCLHGHFKPNSSLFGLPQLRDLNLAYNDFNASPIPSGFNKLTVLESLNLSHSWFSGQIPPEILHLTKLVSLDLSSCFNLSQSRPLFIEKPYLGQFVRNLTNLRHLDMSYVNISSEIPQTVSNLSSLRSICLHKCHLFGRLPLSVLLSPTIQSIDLSTNPYLESYLPEFNGSNSLVLLDLSETSLSGNIPDSIGNLKHLNVLRIHDCNIRGKVPFSIGSLSHLTFLILSSSKLSGSLPSSIGNLSYLNTLSLSSNNFAGEIPASIQNLNRLTYVDVGNNEFTGTLPPNITSLSNLKYFYASLNIFVGTIPSTLFTIPSLEMISVNNNQLNGPLEIGNISSMSKLRELDLSQNDLTGPIPSTLFTIPSLETILVNNNQLNGPLEIRNISTMPMLQKLDLSQNVLTGPIPRSISKFVNLVYLDLTYFNTQEPFDFGIFWDLNLLTVLALSHINATTTIDLNILLSSHLKSLTTLALSGNHVSPTNMSSVSILSSRLNRLEMWDCGITRFPEFIRTQQYMSSIDLSNNKIKGGVPSWLWKLPKLTYVVIDNNMLSGIIHFPKILSKRQMAVISLSKNNFSGEIPRSICGMTSLELVDLSNNNLNGSVPQCLNALIKRSLSVLNLGGNHFGGKLPDIFLNGRNLRSLNVGYNQLTGKLPRSLSDCFSLEVLNLEHNRVSDKSILVKVLTKATSPHPLLQRVSRVVTTPTKSRYFLSSAANHRHIA